MYLVCVCLCLCVCMSFDLACSRSVGQPGTLSHWQKKKGNAQIHRALLQIDIQCLFISYVGLFYGYTGLFDSNCHSVSYTEKRLDAQGSFVDMISYIGLFYGSIGLIGANRHPVSRAKKYLSTEGSLADILRVFCCRLCGAFFEVNIFAEHVGLFCAYIRLFGASFGIFLRYPSIHLSHW